MIYNSIGMIMYYWESEFWKIPIKSNKISRNMTENWSGINFKGVSSCFSAGRSYSSYSPRFGINLWRLY